jgi:hypothetical protein
LEKNFKQQNLEQLKETRARKRAAKETDDINTWGCDRLRNECRTRGIKGFSNKSRRIVGIAFWVVFSLLLK